MVELRIHKVGRKAGRKEAVIEAIPVAPIWAIPTIFSAIAVNGAVAIDPTEIQQRLELW